MGRAQKESREVARRGRDEYVPRPRSVYPSDRRSSEVVPATRRVEPSVDLAPSRKRPAAGPATGSCRSSRRGRRSISMCRKRPFATHASADPAGQPWSSAPEGSRPRSRRPPSCPDAGHARRRPFVHRRPSSRRRIESPAGERNHPAALAHRPEPPAASALVAATAGWSARALPAFEDGWWRTHGLPPEVDHRGSRSTSASTARAFETLTSRSTSRLGRAADWGGTAALLAPDASTVPSQDLAPPAGLDAGEFVTAPADHRSRWPELRPMESW